VTVVLLYSRNTGAQSDNIRTNIFLPLQLLNMTSVSDPLGLILSLGLDLDRLVARAPIAPAGLTSLYTT
jgi:hypothetical protein